MRFKKFTTTLCATVVVVLVVVSGWRLIREIRHARLNALLIATITDERYGDALGLIQQGADGTARKNADTSLIAAANRLLHHMVHHDPAITSNDNSDTIIALLYGSGISYFNMNSSKYCEMNPLMEPLALALLDTGAPMNFTLEDGSTLLDKAVSCHHHRVVERLLNSEPGLIRNHPPVLYADAIDTATFLAHGVDPRGPDADAAMFNGDGDKLEVLMSRGARVNITNSGGETPLITACEWARDSAAQALIRHGANVNARADDGCTPFLLAAEKCRLETIREMAIHGADTHARTSSGDTALIFAVTNPDERVFFWMLKQGIDVNLVGNYNNNALSVALMKVRCGFTNFTTIQRGQEVAQVLRKHGARMVVPKFWWLNRGAPGQL